MQQKQNENDPTSINQIKFLQIQGLLHRIVDSEYSQEAFRNSLNTRTAALGRMGLLDSNNSDGMTTKKFPFGMALFFRDDSSLFVATQCFGRKNNDDLFSE